MARVERERPLHRLGLFLPQIECVQARGQIGPQRRVVGVGLDCALEQFPRTYRIAPLHHAQPQLIQHRRMSRRHLRGPCQELVRLAGAAGGARRLGSLNEPQDCGTVRGCGIDGIQAAPLWCYVDGGDFIAAS